MPPTGKAARLPGPAEASVWYWHRVTSTTFYWSKKTQAQTQRMESQAQSLDGGVPEYKQMYMG